MSRGGGIFSPMHGFIRLLLAISFVPALREAQRPNPVAVRSIAVDMTTPACLPVELTPGQRVIAGVLVGGAVGAAVGALVGAATCGSCDEASPVLISSAVGAGAGVVVGIIWAGVGMSSRLRRAAGLLPLVDPPGVRDAAAEPGTRAALGLR